MSQMIFGLILGEKIGLICSFKIETQNQNVNSTTKKEYQIFFFFYFLDPGAKIGKPMIFFAK